MGYQLFAPNFRGSANYGYSFFKMVEQDWGDGPRLDMTAGIDWLIDQKPCGSRKTLFNGRQLRRVYVAFASREAS
ncbi:prolyl oligopeptidase family serine peptidase [Bacillus haynesii]|nr:prolyl oligopeptidase family serine peptidase [Bacillus haynesii]MEC1470799.1 prolyl oligopeptidase family serine peptidase [Bacillus haynesii]MEC1475671.1 prolyl oligopeptidase family serine peptidase [Bacillus haynesii]MEC1485304.1 prolyl oligopeptidase family serine peptidase [Bacillus haynesii]